MIRRERGRRGLSLYLSIMRVPGQTGEAQGWMTGRKVRLSWLLDGLRVNVGRRVSKSDANNTALLHWQAGVERWALQALFCAAALRHRPAACAAGPKHSAQHHIKFAPWRHQGRAIRHAAQLMHQETCR